MRTQIYLSADLHQRCRAAGLNVSAVCQEALEEELANGSRTTLLQLRAELREWRAFGRRMQQELKQIKP
jgi:post-segregation antitoxin (ccd killing protein)